MKYSPSDLMELFGQSKETIRLWSITFKTFLSPSASPELKGQRRFYDDNDLEVFALIHNMKSRGITFDDILLALANGERGIIPNTQTAITPAPSNQLAILSQRIEVLESEVERLRDNAAENRLLKEQLAAAQSALLEAYKRIGKLEG